MRGTRAKALRRAVYGDGGSSRARQWSSATKPVTWLQKVTNHLGVELGRELRRLWTGTVVADAKRRLYQRLKRDRRGMSAEAVRTWGVIS